MRPVLNWVEYLRADTINLLQHDKLAASLNLACDPDSGKQLEALLCCNAVYIKLADIAMQKGDKVGVCLFAVSVVGLRRSSALLLLFGKPPRHRTVAGFLHCG